MDLFVYSRDAPDAGPLRDDLGLLEQHWSYMDSFVDALLAGNPLALDAGAEIEIHNWEFGGRR